MLEPADARYAQSFAARYPNFGYNQQAPNAQYTPPDLGNTLHLMGSICNFPGPTWNNYYDPNYINNQQAFYDQRQWFGHQTGNHYLQTSPVPDDNSFELSEGSPQQNHGVSGNSAECNASPNQLYSPYTLKMEPPDKTSTPNTISMGPTTPMGNYDGVNGHVPSYDWMKSRAQQLTPSDDETDPPINPGKTRTKDKYRVVYTDNQRMELEKEFRTGKYITIKRKTELAAHLSLSERQVKIWFQNRRAKERKQKGKAENRQQYEFNNQMHPEFRSHLIHPQHQPIHPSQIYNMQQQQQQILNAHRSMRS